jgi:predicted Rossmann fold nucleotide-binding protein DprA/Smf involved in DNA uptake
MSITHPDLQTINPESPAYPIALKTCTAFKKPPTLHAIGNLNLLTQTPIALFCSIKCPGELILKTYDLAQALRDHGIPVISGFHSPIEKDCLKILQRGTQPIIHCPARSIHKTRPSPDQLKAIEDNRLLILSPFSASYPRVTTELALKRNEMIGAIAHTIFIAYAAPNSKTIALAQSLTKIRKAVFTFDSDHTKFLQEQHIIGLDIDTIVQQCLETQIIGIAADRVT